MAEYFAFILLGSISCTLKEVEFENRHHTSCKNLLNLTILTYFKSKSLNFHTRLGLKMTKLFALILLQYIVHIVKGKAFKN